MVRGVLGRLFKLDDMREKQSSLRVVHTKPIGSTGTESYSGYPHEEYLQKLRGRLRAVEFDKMRRSDSQIKMMLTAVKAPILGAEWTIHPADGYEEESWALEDQELIKQILFKGMDKSWKDFLRECLTFVDFGHSVFEVIDGLGQNPNIGQFNSISSLQFISQKTIERWNLNQESFKLESIDQYAWGDTERLVNIPSDFLLVFTLDKEGSNYEGISALRACYGNFFRKNNYLKLNAIGIEKFAVPTPKVTVPSNKGGTEESDRLAEALEAYCTHEKNYLMIPEGWEVEFNTNNYDPQKVEVSIDNEDKRMSKAFLQNFLELGLNGKGSHAQSGDLSTFFLSSLDHIAEIISGQINQVLIPRLIKLNRGPRPSYPQLKHGGITDDNGLELSNALAAAAEKRLIQPDDMLEEFLRKKLKVPMASEQGRREVNPSQHQLPSNQTLSERVRARRGI